MDEGRVVYRSQERGNSANVGYFRSDFPSVMLLRIDGKILRSESVVHPSGKPPRTRVAT
jgi:hypothetical protein